MTTVPEPLSADLIPMSIRVLSSLQECRSRAVKLSPTGAGVKLKRSYSQLQEKCQAQGPC